MNEHGDNDFESVEVKKEDRSLLLILSVLVVITAAVFAIFFTDRKEIPEEPPAPAVSEEKLPPSPDILPRLPSIVGEAETLSEPAEEPRPPVVLPPLRKSDPFVRQIMEEIGEGRLPSSWLEA